MLMTNDSVAQFTCEQLLNGTQVNFICIFSLSVKERNNFSPKSATSLARVNFVVSSASSHSWYLVNCLSRSQVNVQLTIAIGISEVNLLLTSTLDEVSVSEIKCYLRVKEKR